MRVPHRSSPAALLAFATAASAQDGLPPIEYTFPEQGTLTFYGQINKGVLQLRRRNRHRELRADRQRQLQYPRRPEVPSGVRCLDVRERQRDRLCAVFLGEREHPRHLAERRRLRVHQRQHPQARLHPGNDRYGKFWLGQGGMATDGIQEIDLSGTDVIAYSDVADFGRRPDHPLLRPRPELRRKPQRRDHRRRLRQLRRRPPGPRPLRYAGVQQLDLRRRLRPRPALRRADSASRTSSTPRSPTRTFGDVEIAGRARLLLAGGRHRRAGAAPPRACTRPPAST